LENKRKHESDVIYNDRLKLITKYQFEDTEPLQPGKHIRELMCDVDEKGFVFSDGLFNRIFAPTTTKEDIVNVKFLFDLDMQRLNGELKSLSPWITDHRGRVGIVILADAINYTVNYKKKDMYKFYEDAVGISYLMH
jgi:hypothetical protein